MAHPVPDSPPAWRLKKTYAIDLALNRLLKPAKKASSPVARTPGRAGKDGFYENATKLAQGSLYGGMFGFHCNTLSLLLKSDYKNICAMKSHQRLTLRRGHDSRKNKASFRQDRPIKLNAPVTLNPAGMRQKTVSNLSSSGDSSNKMRSLLNRAAFA
jgi:hypothetical protein